MVSTWHISAIMGAPNTNKNVIYADLSIKILAYEHMNIYSDIDRKRFRMQREEILEQIANTLPREELLYELAELFKIFGDSSRIRILSLLSKEKLCVNEISKILNLSNSAISHQLRILRQARLVRYQKQGKEVYYELDDDHIEKIFEQGLEHIQEM